MLIAFEGPDEVGKSTSAKALTSFMEPVYNATKENHAKLAMSVRNEAGLVGTFDRIDWFSHMVYRLALPTHEWNDDRPRTVFAMPDTHLVLKMHTPGSIIEAPDEPGYTPGKVAAANEMYYYQVDFLMQLNRLKDYQLFKTVSIVEVRNDQKNNSFTQQLTVFDSPTNGHTRDMLLHRLVDSDESLLEFLREEDRKIG
ncbi:thymidylate kinase [Microbacterium phage Luna18]|nr:AAA-ATPase [Microbacterium phage Chepli]QZE10334.1 thymidylate kinase [Microbacterium phage KatChan]URQ04897.1 thymidylate kinase [Microbacterium phage Luna18]